MKVTSYQEMLSELKDYGPDPHDLERRRKILDLRPYSVIIEAGFLELDSLNKWIDISLPKDSIEWLFYDKIGYDYGIAEYFGAIESEVEELKTVIPRIFTIFPQATSPSLILRTNGYENWVDYSKDDTDAIVVRV